MSADVTRTSGSGTDCPRRNRPGRPRIIREERSQRQSVEGVGSRWRYCGRHQIEAAKNPLQRPVALDESRRPLCPVFRSVVSRRFDGRLTAARGIRGRPKPSRSGTRVAADEMSRLGSWHRGQLDRPKSYDAVRSAIKRVVLELLPQRRYFRACRIRGRNGELVRIEVNSS